MSTSSRGLWLAALLAAAGCSSTPNEPAAPEDAATPAPSDASADPEGQDAAEPAGADATVAGPDASVPAGADASAVPGADAGPSLGKVGAACTQGAQCASGSCTSTFPGGYCSAPCPQGTCAEGVCGQRGALTLCLATCTGNGDCRSAAGYTCSGGVCMPPCATAADCGPGMSCQTAVCVKAPAVPCAKDSDCPSKLCLLPEKICTSSCSERAGCALGDGCAYRPTLDASGGRTGLRALCYPGTSPGTDVGGACALDADCRSGFCHLGVCSEACASTCPNGLTCVRSQETLKGAYPWNVKACLPGQGSSVYYLSSRNAAETSLAPVPEHAVSFTLLMEGSDGTYPMATSLLSPSGTTLFTSNGGFFDQPVRFLPENQVGTMMVPISPKYPLETGKPYTFVPEVCDPEMTCSGTPITRVLYKYAPGGKVSAGKLDVNFFFNGTAGHYCGSVSAATAPSSSPVQSILQKLRTIYAKAGVTIDQVSYRDLGRKDLESINADVPANLEKLFATSAGQTGRAVNVYFIKGFSQQGLLGISGGIPGPPLAGTTRSGVAVSWACQCYGVTGAVVAHEVGHFLGLFHNIEQDENGNDDPTRQDDLDDTTTSPNNLMYWNEQGGEDLSAGQGFVMRNNYLVE